MESVAKRLVASRKKRGITQKELARLTGTAQGTISAIERGKTTKPLNLIVIAKVLGVNPYWLWTGEEQEGSVNIDELRRVIRASTKAIIESGEELTPERLSEVVARVCEIGGLNLRGREWNDLALEIAVAQALELHTPR